jgi:3-oxoadipate enol-lactonase
MMESSIGFTRRTRAADMSGPLIMEDAPTVRTSKHPRLALDVTGSGAALVFLHGIGGNRRNWKSQLATLSDQFRCIAFDFRGYGESDDVESLDFTNFVDDIECVLAELSVERCHLFGLSMGGLVAQAFYARHSAQVLSLGLIACRPGSAPVFEDSKAFAQQRTEPLEAANDAVALVDARLPRLLGPTVSADAREQIRESLLRLRPDSYRRVLAARGLIQPFLDLGDIKAPTLVVAGSHDQVAPLKQMEAMAASIPGSTFEIIAGAGHLMNIEQPERFNALSRAFLSTTR